MKRINYLLFVIFMLFSCTFYVKASCTDEEIALLKEDADNIKVTYKHLGAVIDEDGIIYYNRFNVNIKNVPDDFYVLYLDGTIKFAPTDGLIEEVFINGTYYFDIYSSKCEEKISQIKVFIPKFNIYSLDSLCEGVNGDDFALCGKYYEYDVEYDDFVARVTSYRNTHGIYYDATDSDEEEESTVLDTFLNFVIQYKVYIFICLLILVCFIVLFVVIRNRRKRNILK